MYAYKYFYCFFIKLRRQKNALDITDNILSLKIDIIVQWHSVISIL